MAKGLSWTSEDIAFLKKGFEQKDSIKTLAWKLNRTPTALNKALTRFGIRPYSGKREREDAQRFSVKTFSALDQKDRAGISEFSEDSQDSTRNEKSASLEEQLMDPPREKTSLAQVIDFLKGFGYNIQKKAYCKECSQENLLLLNHKPTSAIHLLVTANVIRLQTQQPIFEL